MTALADCVPCDRSSLLSSLRSARHACPPTRSAARGMVVLTVSGMIGKTNRGPLDPKRDSLLALHKHRFQAGLRLRPADAAVASTQGDRDGAATGVRQARHLHRPAARRGARASRGGEAARSRFVAVNGYTGWLAPEDIDGSDWILALEADGEPLGLGQQGPIWLLNTRSRGREAERRSSRPLGLGRVLSSRVGE